MFCIYSIFLTNVIIQMKRKKTNGIIMLSKKYTNVIIPERFLQYFPN